MRKSKRWIKKERRFKHAWEKSYEEDKDKRILPPEFSFVKEDLRYIEEAAHREGCTRSCQFEKMIRWAFTCGEIPATSLLSPVDRSKSPAGLLHKKEQKIRRPKFFLHPAYDRMIRSFATQHHKTYSLVVAEICFLYRQRYPIYLVAYKLPPLF